MSSHIPGRGRLPLQAHRGPDQSSCLRSSRRRRGLAPLATPSSHAVSARHARNGVHSATEAAARAWLEVLVHWRPPCREDPVSTSEGGSGALVHGRAEP